MSFINKKYLLFFCTFQLLLSSVTGGGLRGQNPYYGSLTVNTQLQVDTFDYTHVYGNLTITDGAVGNPDPILDLGSLESLRYVAGNVSISGNSRVKYVEGSLDSLYDVGGDLKLSSNDSLLVFRGLQNARIPPARSVSTGTNPMLHTLDAFNGVDSIWRFSSYNNTALQHIRVLQKLRYVDWELVFNKWDTDTVSFPELRRVRKFLPVGLKRLDYLDVPKLDTVVSIEFAYNSLDEFNGFQNLKEIITLRIHDNPDLHTIDGFNGSSVSSYFIVERCDRLQDFSGFSNLQQIGSTSNLYGNLTNGVLRVNENANLKSLSGLDSIHCPTKFTVSMTDNDSLKSLSALSHIEYFTTIKLIRNGNLYSLDGLHNARDTIWWIYVQGNQHKPYYIPPDEMALSGLSEAIGFDSVRHVATDCEIWGGDHLINVDAFNNLKTVGGNFFVFAGNRDIDLQGYFQTATKLKNAYRVSISNYYGQGLIQFDSLQQTGSIGLSGYPAVQIIEGLPNLKQIGDENTDGSISFANMKSAFDFGNLFHHSLKRLYDSPNSSGGYVSLIRMYKLSSTASFPEMDFVPGKFYIQNAPLLTDISHFHNLDSLTGNVNLYNVPQLEDCTPLCHLKTNGYWPGEVEHYGEVPQSCLDFTELTFVDCDPVNTETVEEPTEGLSVHPNPFDAELTVQLDAPRRGTLLLYDGLGRLHREQSLTTGQIQITLPLPDLPSGMYYLVLRSDDTSETITRTVWRW